MDLLTPLSDLPGVGPAKAKGLEKLGLVTARDLLGHFPRDYQDRRTVYAINDAPLDTPVCVRAILAEEPRRMNIRRGLDVTRIKVVDESAAMLVSFFNQGYLRQALHRGDEVILYGAVALAGRHRQMTNPQFEHADRPRFSGRIAPVYPLTAGISSALIAGLAETLLPQCAGQIPEILPEPLREDYQLPGAAEAYRQIHFPDDMERAEAARRRFAFEELLCLSVGLALLRGRRAQGQGAVFSPSGLDDFYALLPFSLTGAQRRVIAEAAEDMASGRAMNRLVQGDVGSGKTAVAAACIWLCHSAGWQSAMMAPTEILAQQHHKTLSALLAPAGLRVELLTASRKAAEKRAILTDLKEGRIHLLVGTHAILSDTVAFHRLGLVVADEQHRFGVEQRAALAAKGNAGARPHVLVMSATPIPRTLALIIYGDLDLSVIDELPPGRTPVKTLLVGQAKRQRMYGFVRDQVRDGRQVYMVCPAIEENTDTESAWDLKAVTEYARVLREQVFPDLRVGLVHGKLKPKEKALAMAAFAAGELDILVATTVIEVGVDVPNANLMIIENADRYGLSQLHQLRGRVGRGKYQSWCILVSDHPAPETRARLKTLVSTSDGFQIAEEDLKLRGPGDFFGARQHGLPTLRVADQGADARLLKSAQDAAAALLSADPDLSAPEHQPLLGRIQHLFQANPDMFN